MQRYVAFLLAVLLVFPPGALAHPPLPPPAPLPPSPQPDAEFVHLENAADVRRVVDDVLRRLANREAGAPKPVVLLVRDDRVPWDALNRELAVALARYDLDVQGLAAGSSGMTEEQRNALGDISRESTHEYVITAEEKGSRVERVLRRIGRVFGMQQWREHHARLSAHRRMLAEETAERRRAGESEDSIAKDPPKGDFRFQFVQSVPTGFGGGARAQASYLFIAGMNTGFFYAASPFTHGWAEALIFALTYLYQAGQFRVNYWRQGGRAPRWEFDPTTGQQRLVADKTRTYTRGFFYAVTFGIVAAANAIVMLPLLLDGSVDPLWALERVLTNSALGVFAFAPVEALIALQKGKQAQLDKEAAALEKRVETDRSLSVDAAQALAEEAQSLRRRALLLGVAHWSERNGFIGVVYPYIKNNHFLGQGLVRLALVAMGVAGMAVDLIRNGRRLHWRWPRWLGGQAAVATKTSPPSREVSCATQLYLTTADAVAPLLPPDKPK